MGGKELTTQTSQKITITDYLKKLCSYALSLGMPTDEYWYGDPYNINYYVEAEELRMARKNRELWLQGFYVYNAIGSLVPILNPFSKDHKAKPYMKEPIPITEQERELAEQKRVDRVYNYIKSVMENQTSSKGGK